MRNVVPWSRLVAAVAGIYMMLVPLFTTDSADDASIWVAELVGGVIAATAIAALWTEAGQLFDTVEAMFGVVLVAAPWVLDYAGLDGAARNAWVVGAIVVAASAVAYFMQARQPAARATTSRHRLLHH